MYSNCIHMVRYYHYGKYFGVLFLHTTRYLNIDFYRLHFCVTTNDIFLSTISL